MHGHVSARPLSYSLSHQISPKFKIALKSFAVLLKFRREYALTTSLVNTCSSKDNDVFVLRSKGMHSITVGTWVLATTTAYRQ